MSDDDPVDVVDVTGDHVVVLEVSVGTSIARVQIPSSELVLPLKMAFFNRAGRPVRGNASYSGTAIAPRSALAKPLTYESPDAPVFVIPSEPRRVGIVQAREVRRDVWRADFTPDDDEFVTHVLLGRDGRIEYGAVFDEPVLIWKGHRMVMGIRRAPFTKEITDGKAQNDGQWGGGSYSDSQGVRRRHRSDGPDAGDVSSRRDAASSSQRLHRSTDRHAADVSTSRLLGEGTSRDDGSADIPAGEVRRDDRGDGDTKDRGERSESSAGRPLTLWMRDSDEVIGVHRPGDVDLFETGRVATARGKLLRQLAQLIGARDLYMKDRDGAGWTQVYTAAERRRVARILNELSDDLKPQT